MLLLLGNQSYLVNENFELYNTIRSAYVNMAIGASEDIALLYRQNKEMTVFWEQYTRYIAGVMKEAIENSCAVLFDAEIYHVTPDAFLKKYHKDYMDILPLLAPVKDQLDRISELSDAMELQRKNSFSGGGRWIGGGFGVKGAIKGAVTASAFNAIGSAMRGIGSAISCAADNATIRRAFQEVFDDPKTLLVMEKAAYYCCLGCFYGVRDELEKHDVLDPVAIDFLESDTICTNALRYASDEEQMQELLIKSLFLDPYNLETFDELSRRFPNLNGLKEFGAYFLDDRVSRHFKDLDAACELAQIRGMPECEVSEQCDKLKAYVNLAVEKQADIRQDIVALSQAFMKNRMPSSADVDKIKYQIWSTIPTDHRTHAEPILRALNQKQESLRKEEDRERINKVSVNSIDGIIEALRRWISYSNCYAENVNMQIESLLTKLIGFCRKESDFQVCAEKLSGLSDEKFPLVALTHEALTHQASILHYENEHDISISGLFTPDILDYIQLAREGSPIHQYWIIQMFCPDETFSELKTIESNVTDNIAFLFDQPQRYSFDLFMRLRLSRWYEDNHGYSETIENFANDPLCPAGEYEYGKFSYPEMGEQSILSIKAAAAIGYRLAAQYYLNLSNQNENLAKDELYYKILAKPLNTHQQLYEYKPNTKTGANITALYHTLVHAMKTGHISILLHGPQNLVALLQKVWEIIKPIDGTASFYGANRANNTAIENTRKFFNIRSSAEVPLFAYTYKDSNSITKKCVFLMTTHAVYWNDAEQKYFRPYKNKPVANCMDSMFSAFENEQTRAALHQIYTLGYYSCYPYHSSIDDTQCERMALYGNPYAISRLLLKTDMSDERRQSWSVCREKWIAEDKCFSVCPICLEPVEKTDLYCPECGTKLE